MQEMGREAFRDYLLDRNAPSGETDDTVIENCALTEEEEKEITTGWYADDRASQEMILEAEKELLEAERDANRDDGAGEAEGEAGDLGEYGDSSWLHVRGWSFPKNIPALEREFFEYYKSYTMTHDPEVERWLEKELIRILDELCTYKIYLRIRYHHAYNLGEELRIAHDGHVRALEQLCRSKEENRFLKESEALAYFRTIYLNQTRDYFRYWKKQAQIVIPIPGDEEIHQQPKKHGEYVEKSQGYIFRGGKSKKYQAQVHEILKLYFQELMDYDGEPPKALSVMYARVLYQLEPLFDPEAHIDAVQEVMRKRDWSLDPESKRYEEHWASAERAVEEHPTGASPAWAMKRMGSRTVEALENDSELSMQRNFDGSLVWGNSMRRMLNRVSGIHGDVLWKDIVFGAHFTKANVQAWSDSVHKSTLIRTAGVMAKNDGYREYAQNVLGAAHPLMKEYARRTTGKGKKGRGENR